MDCSFNAPRRFDFESLQNEDNGDEFFDNAEQYFEIDHEADPKTTTPSSKDGEDIKESPDERVAEAPTVEKSQKADANSDSAETEKGEPQKKPGNLVAKWDASKVTKQQNLAKRKLADTPKRRSLREAVKETVESVNDSPRLVLPDRGKIRAEKEVTAKLKVTPKRLGTNLNVPRLDTKNTVNDKDSSSAAISRFHMVARRTPDVIRKARLKMGFGKVKMDNKSPLTKDGIQQKMAESRALAGKIANGAAPRVPSRTAAAARMPPALPAKERGRVTNPQPFKFSTDSRIKQEGPLRAAAGENVDFTKMLRSYGSAKENPTQPCTRPRPFNLSGGKEPRRPRHRSAEPRTNGEKFVSTAEAIIKFETGTVDRFRTLPRNRSVSPGMRRGRAASSSPPRLTHPHTPKLATRGRSRPVHCLSAAEREQLELEAAQKNQFRARAIGEGVPRLQPAHVEPRPNTEPRPFHFSNIPKRPLDLPPEPKRDFHAQPMPDLSAPKGIPAPKPHEPIIPQSPAFALKERLNERKRKAVDDEPDNQPCTDRIIKAKPAPHFGIPCQTLESRCQRGPTEVQPFSFADRDAMMQQKKQEKIERILEEERRQREFKAHPVPDLSRPAGVPNKTQVLAPTKVEPFQLQVDKRGEQYRQKWQETVEAEEQKRREAAKFKARPAIVLHKEPFQPHPSDKPLSDIMNFELHSDRRAVEREAYERQKRQREADLDAMKRQLEDQRRHDEEERIRQLRREAVPKANPVRHYAPVHVQGSDKPPTVPRSPKFETDNRLAGRKPEHV